MNLPNSLTLLRIFIVPLLVVVLLTPFSESWFGLPRHLLGVGLFLGAALTDYLDGHFARSRDQVTRLGQLLDPIADKLLISAALISLVQIHRIPAWMAVVIVGREFAVTGLRGIAASEGYIIRASDLGKTKMISQVVAISMVLLSIHWPVLASFAILCMWGVVAFSMISAVDYFRKFWRRVDISVKRRRRRELLRLERRRQRAARVSRAQAKLDPTA